ncbi:MAG: hypothetical protein ACREAB_11880 [Blastocatellia bacterium]
MYQTCQACSYESPIGARFCRQCGVQLYVETEASAAGTRNIGRQEPALSVATAGSGHLPPSIADTIAGETERYYQAPSYVSAAPAPLTAPIKSRIKNWRWFMLLLVLIIGVTIGALVTGSMMDSREVARTPEEQARRQQQQEERRRQDEERRRQQEERRRQDEFRREAQNQAREAENRAREALNHAREALRQADEATRRASEAGAALAPTDEKLLDFGQYEYPNATVSSWIRIPGREMLTMRTTDGFDAVSQFYARRLGAPIITINESIEKRLIFQSNTTPLISVSVETVPGPKGPELKITVLRSPFRFPRPDEPQN